MTIRRRGDKCYYYHSVRVGGKVRTRYRCANGEALEKAARMASIRAEMQTMACGQAEDYAAEAALMAEDDRAYRAKVVAARAEIRAIEAPVKEMFDRVEAVFRAAMEAAGFRRTWRKWRKAREGGDVATKPKSSKPRRVQGVPAKPDERAALEASLMRVASAANAGDGRAIEQVHRLLAGDTSGLVVKLFDGDPAVSLERRLIGRLAADDTKRLATRVHVDALQADLLGPSPTPLESLLVGRIVACWLAAHDADTQVAIATIYTLNEEGEYAFTYKPAEFWEAMRDRAHRRFNAAVKSLALVRKFALPTFNLFQVGIVTGGPGAGGRKSKETPAIECEAQPPPKLLALDGGAEGEPGKRRRSGG